MSKVAIVETRRQPVGVTVTKSFEVGITTKGFQTIVVPTMDVVKKGVLIKSATKLGNGSSGVSR
jgi:hypothetical protein